MRESFVFLTARESKTSARHRIHESKKTASQQKRPLTSSLGRGNLLPKYRSIQNAEEELNQTFREQMTGYAMKEIKNISSKYNYSIEVCEGLDPRVASADQAKASSMPKNMKQMKICGLAQALYRTEKVLDEPIFVNAKEKLSRMLSRKQEMEKKYQTLQQKFQNLEREKLSQKRLRERMFQNPPRVSASHWHNEWKNESINEVSRYRTRLSLRHRKNNSNFTIEWQ